MRRTAAVSLLILGLPLGAAAQVLEALPEPPLDHIPVDHRALVDWYPGNGGFRISGGVREMPGLNRRGEESGTLRPYLGLGWQDSTLDGRLSLGLDLGALYRGRPDLRIDESSPLADLTDNPSSPRDGLPFHPVISVSITYRF